MLKLPSNLDIRLIICLHNLLLADRTGDPNSLTVVLGISVRSVYNYIGLIKKEMNAPIVYGFGNLVIIIKGLVNYNLKSN